jgi:hypothetical protein
MKDLTDREFRIKQALEKKGWTIQWRGVPANRWLWASKSKNAKRYISVEMTTDGVTLVRGHGSFDWLLGAVGELKEALAENQPHH